MSINYGRLFSRRKTPQSEPIPGSAQIANSAGGFGWAVDDWTRLDRFLILGSEGGSYYAKERTLTRENAEAVERCLIADGARLVARIRAVSAAGRAPKNDPAIFALAMAAKLGDFTTRRLALAALPAVCRTGTQLMHFAAYVQAFGGWGRGTRTAVQRWFNDKPPTELAYQLVKYQSRDGWSTRDLLRLAHPKAPTPEHDALYRWVVRGELPEALPGELALVGAFERAKRTTDVFAMVRLVTQYGLPRECVPTEWLRDPCVWEALLEHMPMTAMIRNLATMTRVGLLVPMSRAARTVTERLRDGARLRTARIHPIAVLSALQTYAAGRGVRGQHTWTPTPSVVDALNDAFYATFKQVEPTGKRTLLALDVSGSMGAGAVAGVPGLTPRVASAAMALVTAATEPQHSFVAFTGKSGQLGAATAAVSALDISPRWPLEQAVARVSNLPFGATDCALPMLWALEQRMAVDTFVVYTDSETWCGQIHASQALRQYRQRMGIPAKLVVVGMVSNGFTIADPTDGGMLDVVGFDTAAPAVISDFSKTQPDSRLQ
jgi:60 kDa SS-A/Ro ribonucleoprotein